MNERDYLIAKKLKQKLSGITDIVDFRIFGSRVKGILYMEGIKV